MQCGWAFKEIIKYRGRKAYIITEDKQNLITLWAVRWPQSIIRLTVLPLQTLKREIIVFLQLLMKLRKELHQ